MNTFCDYFNQQQCHSCEWITLDYPAQLKKKESLLRQAFASFEKFELLSSQASSTLGFRNRAKMTVTGTVDQPIIGLVGENKLDLGRELLNCPIHHPALNALIQALPDYIRDYQLIPYQIENKKGELKGLILFYSPTTRQMYLRFVLRSQECVSRLRKLLPRLQAQFPELVCVSANLQPIAHAILEGPEEIFITEIKSIDHQLGKLKLKLSPQAFVQTNVEAATRLYQTAGEWIGTIQPSKMLELFCGQGAFSFFAAKGAGEILGVEINAEAVKIANETSQTLQLENVRFQCTDANQLISEFSPDLILVNPPRRGLSKSMELIQKQLPQNIIYSSCSLESLHKDLAALSPLYQIQKMQIFDLFPHTEHFETLVLLLRRS